MKRIISIPIFLTLGFSFVLAAAEKKLTPPQQIQNREYQFEEAKRKMPFTLFVPSKYDKAKKTPLVVALHGLGSNPAQIIRYPKMTESAETNGFIVVCPMGYNERGGYGAPAWSKMFHGKTDAGALSEKDVLNVLAIVRKEFNIDENRIYLMGHSMGGGGTMHLGIKYPELWAALAPIAPALFGKPDDLEKAKHLPVIMIQGDKDMLVPVSGVRPWAVKMKELGMTHEYMEVKGGGHLDVAFENIPRIFDFFAKQSRTPATTKPVTP